MERLVGTVVRGLRSPIFKAGDDLTQLVPDILDKFYTNETIEIGEKDVVAITESVVARAQGNYVTIDQVASDINKNFKGQEVGVIFPILSRNRFATILRAIAKSDIKKVILQLSFPSDEVGNHLISVEQMDEAGLDPYKDTLTEKQYRDLFGIQKHEFTGIDYVSYYKEIVESFDKECEIIFSNSPLTILEHTQYVINCDIHTRKRTKALLLKNGAKCVCSLDNLMNESIDGSGYNADYGLLGSNKSTEDTIKLFPRECNELVLAIQSKVKKRTGKTIEVMVYGDGAFKDPVGKIWELADPVVSPGYTKGLEGTPNELKLKYLADNDFKDLEGEELKEAIKNAINSKEDNLVGQMATQGTTPRQLTDLLGSLCDLTSGSGDKGTPIVYIQGYFDNYIN
ncbi:coenzyme F420-0:L-glutamate ligase [Facklamia sp. DSM 111018]|uniref:Coenzyme F420-0:L-glutamate ligase n=1 Tax=Facklamia lactis TaxID=2749967 RepID=A0ABS0LQQ2_9LACT|nr:coenzyme F420-0:L-glutamate ligase [Facklamia lactis]MBG9980490.1 coenzyme F420-0:L-glutamate ligase [Facklamia lactis]MBG9986282.1 coenzyme F420-0:L-glutamate ligase [Facklamia lactis]